MVREFLDFLRTYGIIGLAIAVVIGGKVNDLVSSVVNDLVTPLIFQPLLAAANVADVRQLNYHGIFYGKVVGAFIDFMVVAIVVFCFAKFILREQKVVKK